MGTQTEVCEGLVDLIRDLDTSPDEQVVGPCMAREELARGLLVVVVIGPASTKIHQVGQISIRPCLVVYGYSSMDLRDSFCACTKIHHRINCRRCTINTYYLVLLL